MSEEAKNKASDEIETDKAIIYANKRFPRDSFKNFVAASSFHDGYTQGRADALNRLKERLLVEETIIRRLQEGGGGNE